MNYAYWLANIPGVGNRTIQRLLTQAGCAKELYFMDEKILKTLHWLGETERNSLINSRKEEIEKHYQLLQEQNIRFLSMEEEDYPTRLRHIADAPFGIYIKGTLPKEHCKSVAIVGARRCSEYGYEIAKELGSQISRGGGCVISGMAKGVDAGSHMGALQMEGKTVAVLGCGIDICYPPQHRELYQKIEETGCIVSEYPPGVQPRAGFFPARNRIIAGLCDALVVVEAKERSGSLISADFALEQGKDIYAVPGRINDTLSAGCNALIAQGAGIISNINDFLLELELKDANAITQLNFTNLLLEKEEGMVYSCLSLRPKNVEELLQKTGYSMPQLAEILGKLTQNGYIAETFKNYYIRKI